MQRGKREGDGTDEVTPSRENRKSRKQNRQISKKKLKSQFW